MKRLLQQLLALLTVVFTSSCNAADKPGRPTVHWLQTKTYSAQSLRFAFDGKQAVERLRKALRAKDDRRADAMELLAIVGDCYLIGRPAKATTELTGFYVHGTTGRIEYRVTKHPPLNYGQRPKDLSYESVEVISEP